MYLNIFKLIVIDISEVSFFIVFAKSILLLSTILYLYVQHIHLIYYCAYILLV